MVVGASTPEEKPQRRRFATIPSELRRLLIWLQEQGVEAVMESTAQSFSGRVPAFAVAAGLSIRDLGRRPSALPCSLEDLA